MSYGNIYACRKLIRISPVWQPRDLGVHTLVLHLACGWSRPAPSQPQSAFILGPADGESSLLTSEMRVFIPIRGFRVAWKTGAVRRQHGVPDTHQFHWLQSPSYDRLNLVSEVEWLIQGHTDSKGRKNKSSESRPSAVSIANYFFVVQKVWNWVKDRQG